MKVQQCSGAQKVSILLLDNKNFMVWLSDVMFAHQNKVILSDDCCKNFFHENYSYVIVIQQGFNLFSENRGKPRFDKVKRRNCVLLSKTHI